MAFQTLAYEVCAQVTRGEEGHDVDTRVRVGVIDGV